MAEDGEEDDHPEQTVDETLLADSDGEGANYEDANTTAPDADKEESVGADVKEIIRECGGLAPALANVDEGKTLNVEEADAKETIRQAPEHFQEVSATVGRLAQIPGRYQVARTAMAKGKKEGDKREEL